MKIGRRPEVASFNDWYTSDSFDASFRQSLKLLPWKNLTIVCIGTDRSTGDAFGPLVGTFLQQHKVPNVIGTLADPVHAINLAEQLGKVTTSKVLAIDACLGQLSAVGKVTLRKGPLSPGSGVGKRLGKVGDFSLTAVINVGGFMEYFVLQNTRLHLVYELATRIAESIVQAKVDSLTRSEIATSSFRSRYRAKLPDGTSGNTIANRGGR